MSKYDNDRRVSTYGGNGFSVATAGGDFRILYGEAFNWSICAGPKLEFVQVKGGGFAIGFPEADDAIEALIGPPQ